MLPRKVAKKCYLKIFPKKYCQEMVPKKLLEKCCQKFECARKNVAEDRSARKTMEPKNFEIEEIQKI